MMDDGYDVVETSVPVLFTVVRELNQPRFASLKGKMRAKSAQIKKLTSADIELNEKDLGLSGSPTQVKNIFAPEMKKERIVFEGKPEQQVTDLLNVLKSVKCI